MDLGVSNPHVLAYGNCGVVQTWVTRKSGLALPDRLMAR